MEKEESLSTTQKKNDEIYRAHTKLRDRWNGRSGYSVYFIPVPKDRVHDYIKEAKIRLTPQCGDRVEWINEVEQGDELKEEHGSHNLTRKWKVPTAGCEVKIQRYSCS